MRRFSSGRASPRRRRPSQSRTCPSTGQPGRLFKIDESSLIDRYERAEKLTNEAWSYNETAGLKQLYRRTQLLQVSSYELLESAFPAIAKGGGL
jgi:hypothetical protein